MPGSTILYILIFINKCFLRFEKFGYLNKRKFDVRVAQFFLQNNLVKYKDDDHRIYVQESTKKNTILSVSY